VPKILSPAQGYRQTHNTYFGYPQGMRLLATETVLKQAEMLEQKSAQVELSPIGPLYLASSRSNRGHSGLSCRRIAEDSNTFAAR
jgi:hypothetical protein